MNINVFTVSIEINKSSLNKVLVSIKKINKKNKQQNVIFFYVLYNYDCLNQAKWGFIFQSYQCCIKMRECKLNK